MSGFKVGDKVKYVNAGGNFHIKDDNVYTVLSSDNYQVLLKEVPGIAYHNERFKLIEEKQMFDMKKEKWFIRTPTPEISDAVIEWLKKEQNLKLHNLLDPKTPIEKYGTEACLCGDETVKEFGVTYSESSFFEEDGWKEIKLTFKTVVDTVEYPSAETQAQKDLKELEQQIAKLSEQAAKLRESVK